ncbi:MAG: DUF3422 family protein [Sphingomonadales bacterium]|nr:MAG: DUF3422 family protein [Sphingomonadales bacterium]
MDFGNERPSYPILPPAIIRHLTFRMKTEDNPHYPHNSTEPKDTLRADVERQKRISKHVSEHLNALRRRYSDDVLQLREVVVCPAAGTVSSDDPEMPEIYPSDRSAIIPITKGHTQGRLRVRFDLYSEAYSLTYIYDRFTEKTSGSGQHIAEWLMNLHNDPERFQWLADHVWDANESGGAIPLADEVAKWLAGPALSSKRAEGASQRKCSDEVLADFRTVVICPTPDWKVSAPTFGSARLQHRARDEINPALTDYVERNRNVIRGITMPDGDPNEPSRGGEAVLCGVLGGNALFVAELARWGGRKTESEAIKNFIVYGGHSEAQLGRLVRRCHILGELRHMALVDFDELRQSGDATSANTDLRAADRKLRELETELTGITLKLARLQDEGPNASEEEKRDVTNRIYLSVAEWSKISSHCEGGLIYRIEQSRYYANEFLNTLNHLRVVRLGDWQPYDDFVKRYIMQRFARIDRIGNRYTAMGERMSRLISFKQAITLDNYQISVQETLIKMDTALDNMNEAISGMTETTSGVREASKEQVFLLKEAHWFAMIFVLYYIGSIFAHNFVSAPQNSIIFFDREIHVDEHTFTIWWQTGGIVLVICTFAYIVFNKWRKGRD